MESLSLTGVDIGLYIGKPTFRFQDSKWPALQHLDLACGLQHDFMMQLTSGQRPLLKVVDLSSNFLSLQGVTQLFAGHWPTLSRLDLQYNDFDIASDSCDSVLKQHESFVKSIKVKWPDVQLLVTKEDNASGDSHDCQANLNLAKLAAIRYHEYYVYQSLQRRLDLVPGLQACLGLHEN